MNQDFKTKKNLRICMNAWAYLSLSFGICISLFYSIKSSNIIRGFEHGMAAGIVFGTIMSAYLFIVLLLFDKKLLFYNKIPQYLQERKIRKIYYESIAGNATSAVIKNGGLFLTDDSVLFIPHRFAGGSSVVDIPLTNIRKVSEVGINFLKTFSGGLRRRLKIETAERQTYQFSVWNIDIWMSKINERLRR